jgi:transcriptional regulator with XRE-family HTH domain
LDEAVAFGKVLRRLRKKAGLTQEQLGLEADLRRTYISILELGQQQPSLNTLIKIARALNMPASELMAAVEAELSRANASKQRSSA